MAAFMNNLRQTKDNESYIINEVKQWMFSNEIPKIYIRELYHSVCDVVHTKDILAKFHQFQVLMERVN